MYNGSYAGDRFSTLSQITRANVNSLKVLAAGMKNEIMKTDSGPAEVVIYALGAH